MHMLHNKGDVFLCFLHGALAACPLALALRGVKTPACDLENAKV